MNSLIHSLVFPTEANVPESLLKGSSSAGKPSCLDTHFGGFEKANSKQSSPDLSLVSRQRL